MRVNLMEMDLELASVPTWDIFLPTETVMSLCGLLCLTFVMVELAKHLFFLTLPLEYDQLLQILCTLKILF